MDPTTKPRVQDKANNARGFLVYEASHSRPRSGGGRLQALLDAEHHARTLQWLQVANDAPQRVMCCAVLIFIRAWRLAARRMRALRWGLKRLFARVLKAWAYRPKHAPSTDSLDLGADDSDAVNDEQRWWQLLISPKGSSASSMLPQCMGSSTAFSPSKIYAARTVSTANTVSRRLVNSMENPYFLMQDAVSMNHSTRIPSLPLLLKSEALS
jgi:hypothetical protein